MNKRQAKKQLKKIQQGLNSIVTKYLDQLDEGILYGTGPYAQRCDPDDIIGESPIQRMMSGPCIIIRNIDN